MTAPTIIGLSGSYSYPSRTRALVADIAHRAAQRYSRRAQVYDLSQFGSSLGAARKLSDLDESARRIVIQMVEAEALVVASPVYKGSYTGLFKHLIDLLDPTAFVGKPILLAATGGGDRHTLVIEHQLRPLFGFFEARTLATGIYAAERDFAEGSVSPALAERLARAIEQFTPYLARREVTHAGEPNTSTQRVNGTHVQTVRQGPQAPISALRG
ncbi:FMN reductase (plasmid) [Phyllobacteriaceae bacterium JZ32]